jgi:3-hydroxymyristoyl/3-hydroxydecanoyl-(acyl carrier protein) dehydratase
MNGYGCAFSFVDRISSVEPGVCIRGQYTIPAEVNAFPTSLVAEAVGQLAAWAAMAAVGFTHRPVAGIAGRIELLSTVQPGQVLQLAAELDSVDTESAGYSGTAHADGIPVVRLRDCVGPMLPVEDFDDPKSVGHRFARLSTVGTPPGAFEGLPPLALDRDGGERGEWTRAVLRVPVAAAFFTDHFPRRPVFPGTLLMHAHLQTAVLLAAEIPSAGGAAWLPRVIADVKLRPFIAPGETLSLEAKRIRHADASLDVAVESRSEQRLISSAGIQFAPEVQP